MALFTDIIDWTSAQDTARANEILLAYSERRQCVGDSAIDPLEAGGNAQDTAFWRGMQEWIESECSGFVNHTVAIEGEESVTMFTLSTFRYVAGLHADGFRRATEWNGVDDPTWEYGTIEAGDIRGPWIFEDLQKAFDALRWTITNASNEDQHLYQKSTNGDYKESYSAAVSDAVANWPSSWTDFGTETGQVYFMASAFNAFIGEDEYQVGFSSTYKPAYVSGIPNHINSARDVICLWSTCQWDAYGMEWAEDAWFIAGAVGSTNDDELLFEFDEYDLPSNIPAEPSASLNLANFANTCKIILKWEFSHTL
jgi:hypothetical protein